MTMVWLKAKFILVRAGIKVNMAFAQRMCVAHQLPGTLSQATMMEGFQPIITTLRRYAHAIGHRIEFAVVAEK